MHRLIMKIKILIKVIIYFIFFGLLLLKISCSNKTTTEPEPESDTEMPAVSIISPSPNTIIGDTITIRASAMDNVGVTKVEFYIDDTHQQNGDDNAKPFEFIAK